LHLDPVDGGVHPRFGTRNVILPLVDDRFIEVVEVLDHPASDRAPFGQAVRARSEAGGGWLGWVLDVADISVQEQRLGREAVPGNRRRPDGVELRWRQIGVKGLIADPQLPFFIEWAAGTPHPSADGESKARLQSLEIAGHPDRLQQWCGVAKQFISKSVIFDFIAPRGTPGIMSVTFETPEGSITI